MTITRAGRAKFPTIVSTAVWDPDAGLAAFIECINTDEYLDPTSWYVEHDRLFMPGWDALGRGFAPGQTVTGTLTVV